MDSKLRDIIKYFFLTFISFEVIYFIARGVFTLKPVVLILTLCFTILFTLDKYEVLGKSFFQKSSNKDKPM